MPDLEPLSCLYNAERWPPYERIDNLVSTTPPGLICLVGLNHGFQFQDPSEEAKQDQARLAELVENLIVKYEVKLIGEEQGYVNDRETVAAATARKHVLQVHNLDVFAQEFEETWVPCSPEHGTYYFAWNLVREWHMYAKFCSKMEGARSALLICGLSHLPPLFRLLRDRYGRDGWAIVPICLQPSEKAKQCRDCCWFAQRLELGHPRINVPPGYHLGKINF